MFHDKLLELSKKCKSSEEKGAEIIKKVNLAMELEKLSQEEFYKTLKIFRYEILRLFFTLEILSLPMEKQ